MPRIKKIKRNCLVKKILTDNLFEYGIDQNKSLYLRKKDSIAWEEFYNNRLILHKEKAANITVLYEHINGIKVGTNKEGEFYKKGVSGFWTKFVEKEEVPIIYDLGKIIATHADRYWTRTGEDTIIKYQVISAKKKEKRIEGCDTFISANVKKEDTLHEKLVLDNTCLKQGVNILLRKE